MRGRKPKPAHLRLIEGNPGKRAINRTALAVRPTDGMSPPAHLNADAKKLWRREMRRFQGLGLLADIDRGAFAVYCQTYGVWAENSRALKAYNQSPVGKKSGLNMIVGAGGSPALHPLVRVVRDAMRDHLKAAAEFGATPSARSRVDIGKSAEGWAPPASKFAGLTGGRGASKA